MNTTRVCLATLCTFFAISASIVVASKADNDDRFDRLVDEINRVDKPLRLAAVRALSQNDRDFLMQELNSREAAKPPTGSLKVDVNFDEIWNQFGR